MKQGFIALTSILVLSAIFLSVSVSVAMRSIAQTGTSFGLSAAYTANSLSTLCVEYALIELTRTLNYTGDETIVLDGESCDILTISGSGNTNRTIQTISTVAEHTRRTEVVISEISPDIAIVSWESVTDF